MNTVLTAEQIGQFQEVVLNYYRNHARTQLPWRVVEDNSVDPYKVLVSEFMLQQTQVARVVPKFNQFMQLFPSLELLAGANLAQVLAAWSGLGYNRRARFLHLSAKAIVDQFNSEIPHEAEMLETLPGIGRNTAAAILAYSYNLPVIFIETNIRSVFIHHFFDGKSLVPDSELAPLIEATLLDDSPRQWYWALMDYGSHLKQASPNPSRRSAHHVRQSKFEGSRRQVRGAVLKALRDQALTQAELTHIIQDERLEQVLADLIREQLITKSSNTFRLG